MRSKALVVADGSLPTHRDRGPELLGSAAVCGAESGQRQYQRNSCTNPAVRLSAATATAMVVWRNAQAGLRGRVYDSNGKRAFPASSRWWPIRSFQGLPAHGIEALPQGRAVAFLSSGDLIVAWTEEKDNVSVDILFENRQVIDRNVLAQRFSAAGAPQGTPAASTPRPPATRACQDPRAQRTGSVRGLADGRRHLRPRFPAGEEQGGGRRGEESARVPVATRRLPATRRATSWSPGKRPTSRLAGRLRPPVRQIGLARSGELLVNHG